MVNIREILENNSLISGYKLVTTKTLSYELFYVKDKLETNRVEDVCDYLCTIYVDKDNLRGMANFSIYPYMTKDDINSKIKEASLNALNSLNKKFELPIPCNRLVPKLNTNLREIEINKAIEEISDSIFKSAKEEGMSLNATEIFVKKESKNVINSNGVDVSFDKYSIDIELIPTFTKDEKSVEVYKMLSFGELNPTLISEKVLEELQFCKDRFNAVAIPKLSNIPVVVEGSDNISSLLSYFTENSSYAYLYQKMSIFKENESTQGEDIKGDKIDLTLSPYQKGCSDSSYIDNEGIVLDDVNIIKNGIFVSPHGDNIFGQYLGVRHPSGVLPVCYLKPGSVTIESLKNAPYLRCVKFSNIQCDISSGFFGGEVRLGYYFDGQKEIPVTGFSISGCMHQEKQTMKFSKETAIGKDYYGPKQMIFYTMSIL